MRLGIGSLAMVLPLFRFFSLLFLNQLVRWLYFCNWSSVSSYDRKRTDPLRLKYHLLLSYLSLLIIIIANKSQKNRLLINKICSEFHRGNYFLHSDLILNFIAWKCWLWCWCEFDTIGCYTQYIPYQVGPKFIISRHNLTKSWSFWVIF